jgi:hypothetical protein
MRKLPERRVLASPASALRFDPDGETPTAPPAPTGLDRVATALELRPDGVPGLPAPAPPRPPVIEPLAPGRYRVQFTASAELHDKLERLRGLMRSSVPDGDLAAIIERAVTEKLERLEARRFARTKASGRALPARGTSPSGRGLSPTARKGSPAVGQASPSARDTFSPTRHIPAAMRRTVYERDGGQCCYVDEKGRRCVTREGLEYHHRHPFGHGGLHSVDGISLLCRAHNRYLAEVDYGREAMARHRRASPESRSLCLRI